MRVLIIGAGPAGLALAHGLQKAGIPFSIFDKAPSASRHRHWAFTLGWARPYLLSLLPETLASQLNASQCDPYIDCTVLGEDRIIIYNGQTREKTFTFPIPLAKEINIRRLREHLSQGLDVHYNKKFVRYDLLEHEKKDERIRAYFSDGTSATGTLLVGVDGANSQVRTQLLGSKLAAAETLPFALMNFNASYTADQALYLKKHLHPLVDIAIHPSGHYIRSNILDMPDQDDPTTWTFQILTTWPFRGLDDYDNEESQQGDRLKRLKAHVERDGWAEPYKSLIEWIPADTVVGKDHLKIWKTVPWENEHGGVTLAGDAAHAMTFHRGQGANNSLYDSYCLVEALRAVKAGDKTMEEALVEYDRAAIQRGMEEVQISKAQTFSTHDWDNFINSPVMKLGTKPSHAAWTEGYDAEDVVKGEH